MTNKPNHSLRNTIAISFTAMVAAIILYSPITALIHAKSDAAQLIKEYNQKYNEVLNSKDITRIRVFDDTVVATIEKENFTQVICFILNEDMDVAALQQKMEPHSPKESLLQNK